MRLRSDQMRRLPRRQNGFSLIGLLCTLLVFGLIGVLGVRAGPSVIEYWAVGKAVAAAKAVSKTPAELRASFDKLAAAGYIDSIAGSDLSISGSNDDLQVDFVYQKKFLWPVRRVCSLSTREAPQAAPRRSPRLDSLENKSS